MKDKTIIFFFSFAAFCFFGQKVEAQVADPTLVVSKFASCMSAWNKTRNLVKKTTMLFELFPSINKNCGIEECLVDNGLVKRFIKNDKLGLLPTGKWNVSQYLTCLRDAVEHGVIYNYNTPVWHKDYILPDEYKDKYEIPIQFVSMDFSTSNPLKYKGKDLFFVQGNYIVKIIDFNDPQAKAIRKLSKKHK